MRKEVKVGLLVIICSSILYIGFNYLKGQDFFSTDKKYWCMLDDIDGLTVSNPVTVNGYTVGRVHDIELINQDSLKVTVSVNGDVEITNKTIISLGDDGLINGKAMKLVLNKGDVIYEGGERLISDKEASIMEGIEERARPIIMKLDTILGGVSQLVAPEESLAKILANLEVVSAELKGLPTNVDGFITTTAKQLEGLQITLNKIAKEADSVVVGLKPVVSKLNTVADSVSGMELKKTVAQLNDVLGNLETLTSTINEGKGTVGKLFTEDGLYEQLNTTLTKLQKLLMHFEQEPKDFMAPLGRKKPKWSGPQQ